MPSGTTSLDETRVKTGPSALSLDAGSPKIHPIAPMALALSRNSSWALPLSRGMSSLLARPRCAAVPCAVPPIRSLGAAVWCAQQPLSPLRGRRGSRAQGEFALLGRGKGGARGHGPTGNPGPIAQARVAHLTGLCPLRRHVGKFRLPRPCEASVQLGSAVGPECRGGHGVCACGMA
jgi:hypothetical protein